MSTAAVVFAMPAERAPLVRRLAARRSLVGDLPVRIGRYGGRDVVAVVTGMGTAAASAGSARLLDVLAADGRVVERVLVVGICGAIGDAAIGTLIEPTTVVNSSTGAAFTPTAPGPAAVLLSRNGPSHRFVPAERGGAGEAGVLWTTDAITPPDEAAGLRARGVVALDMETAAVAEVCEQRSLPWAAFRAVSDRTDDEVDEEVFAMANQDGTPNLANVARYVLRHPGRVPHLAAMGRNMTIAAKNAVDAALASLSIAIPATSRGTPDRGAP